MQFRFESNYIVDGKYIKRYLAKMIGTTMGYTMTLANSIIGVGILAMPFCFQKVSGKFSLELFKRPLEAFCLHNLMCDENIYVFFLTVWNPTVNITPDFQQFNHSIDVQLFTTNFNSIATEKFWVDG